MGDPFDRVIDSLERQLERDDLSAEERKDILEEIRDIGREYSERDRWEEEGYERGWR